MIKNLLIVAGIIAVLALLAVLGSALVAVWAAVQFALCVLGIGTLGGYLTFQAIRPKKKPASTGSSRSP